MVSKGNYDFVVNWGDNSTSTIKEFNDSTKTHIYNKAGSYKIIINGIISGWSFADNGDKDKLAEIQQWGTLDLGNTTQQFIGCTQMTITATDIPSLVNTTSLSGAFGNCKSLIKVPNMHKWNVSKITAMDSLFENATVFNQYIGDWDTSNVVNMSYMFCNAAAFNQNIGNWDTSNVVDMNAMFYGASTFNRDIKDWNMFAVTTMSAMFFEATAFNQDIRSWNTANVTNMNAVFYKATAFNRDIGVWNIGQVTTMEVMFGDITLHTSIYNSILTGWAAQSVLNNVRFHAGNSKYSGKDAIKARATLINKGWIISDGGEI